MIKTNFKRKLSPTSINTLIQCPRKYYFQYIEKIKTKPSIHLVKGIIVHSVLENFYKKHQQNLKGHLFDLFEKQVETSKNQIKMLEMSDEDIKHHLEDCKIILETYWMQINLKMKGLIHNQKAENEAHAWYLIKPQLKEKYVKSSELNCVGFVDRIHRDYNGVVTLGDYKTSNKYGIGLSLDYKRQMAIYALLYSLQENETPDFVSVIFLRFGEQVLLEVTPSLLKFARDTIIETHSKTSSDDKEDYPCRESRLCGWCDFKDICSDHSEFEKLNRQSHLRELANKKILCEFCGSKEYDDEKDSKEGTLLVKHKKSCEYRKTLSYAG